MNQAQKAKEWARYFKACLSPESKLGAFRGAMRDGVLLDVLRILKLNTIPQFIEALHQQELITGESHDETDTERPVARVS